MPNLSYDSPGVSYSVVIVGPKGDIRIEMKYQDASVGSLLIPKKDAITVATKILRAKLPTEFETDYMIGKFKVENPSRPVDINWVGDPSGSLKELTDGWVDTGNV